MHYVVLLFPCFPWIPYHFATRARRYRHFMLGTVNQFTNQHDKAIVAFTSALDLLRPFLDGGDVDLAPIIKVGIHACTQAVRGAQWQAHIEKKLVASNYGK